MVPKTVSVGVCAYNEARRISSLLDSVLAQALPSGFAIVEVLVVASGCTDGTDRIVVERAKSDARIVLIKEPERRGKSSALNRILTRYQGDILVLVNGDARLLPGSLSGLVQEFDGDDRVQLACGLPTPDASPNPSISTSIALKIRHASSPITRRVLCRLLKTGCRSPSPRVSRCTAVIIRCGGRGFWRA